MTTLWFDLEATVIKSWDTPFIINQEKIFDFLKLFPCDEIGIFSFAIWDDKDRAFFNAQMKPHLEAMFGIRISHVPTKQELFQAIKKANKKQFDFDDFCDFWGKENGFSDWIRATNTGTHILIDDMVEDCEMKFNHCHIIMRHI
jgi:hypothetical protein